MCLLLSHNTPLIVNCNLRPWLRCVWASLFERIGRKFVPECARGRKPVIGSDQEIGDQYWCPSIYSNTMHCPQIWLENLQQSYAHYFFSSCLLPPYLSDGASKWICIFLMVSMVFFVVYNWQEHQYCYLPDTLLSHHKYGQSLRHKGNTAQKLHNP